MKTKYKRNLVQCGNCISCFASQDLFFDDANDEYICLSCARLEEAEQHEEDRQAALDDKYEGNPLSNLYYQQNKP